MKYLGGIFALAFMIGCGGASTKTRKPGETGGVSQAKFARVAAATQIPIDEQIVGVYNDLSGAVVAVVYKEGDELRMVASTGDTRSNIPASKESAKLFGALPTAEQHQTAVTLLGNWPRHGTRGLDREGFLAHNAHVFTASGKPQADNANMAGVWGDGYGRCEEENAPWGQYSMYFAKDADGDLVIFFNFYATKEKSSPESTIGGQGWDILRRFFVVKDPAATIDAKLLEELKKAEAFCRIGEEKEPAAADTPADAPVDEPAAADTPVDAPADPPADQ